MSKKNWSNIPSVLGRTALAFVFVFGQTAWGAQNQGGKDKPGSSGEAKTEQAKASQTAPSAAKGQPVNESASPRSSVAEESAHHGGPHEGIQVHGHWTIEVHNPDGTLVTHTEFENALTGSGGGDLAAFLARTNTVGEWIVILEGNTTFYLDERGAGSLSPNPGVVIGSLTPSVGANGTFMLSGNGAAPRANAISSVHTQPNICAPTVAPANCNGSSNLNFGGIPFLTSASVSPIAVLAGQIIQVTVIISFS